MIIIGPVAIASNGIIGDSNDLPWYLPEDLKQFKKITLGKTVLMGRRTYVSIFKRLGKALPERKNVVITRQKDFKAAPGVLVFNNLEDAFESLKDGDVYVIGGGQIFHDTLAMGKKMFITHVFKDYEGDVYFPEINWGEWKKMEEEKHEEYSFAVYERIS